MSYRCQACGVQVPPGKPRRVHATYRNSQIVREVPVCESCQHLLKTKTIAELQSRGSVPAPAKGLNWLDESGAS